MRFDTLAGWLAWLEHLHPRRIDLGLERVQRVAQRFTVVAQIGAAGIQMRPRGRILHMRQQGHAFGGQDPTGGQA